MKSVYALDPIFSPGDRAALWLRYGAHWVVGAVLFLLAAARVRGRPGDARVAATLAGIVVALASFDAQGIPFGLALAATLAGALAPWSAFLAAPSASRTFFVVANLAVIAAAPAIAALIALPWWLRRFAPIDPLTIPEWLASRPLQWPWIVGAAPVAFGFLVNEPKECCVGIPVNSPLLLVVPAAIVGFAVWQSGRRRPAVPIVRHGPAGSATRRG